MQKSGVQIIVLIDFSKKKSNIFNNRSFSIQIEPPYMHKNFHRPYTQPTPLTHFKRLYLAIYVYICIKIMTNSILEM